MIRVCSAAAALWLVGVGPTPALADADLASRLNAAIAVDALAGARVAVRVVDLHSGALRFEHGSDQTLIPASNMKVLTALAALSMFGPSHRFETELFADAPLGSDGEIGTLAVRGGGDPALTSEQWWRLAANLRVLGVRRIERGLLLDAGAFDSERWHPNWGVVSARAYNAPVGALNANYGAYSITVSGGAKAGDPVRVRVDPPVAYLRLANRARTVSARAKAGLVLDRRSLEAAEEVIVSGSVRAGSEPSSHNRSVLDPVLYAGSTLRLQLEANGIEVGPETRVGPVGAGMTRLDTFEGPPLAETVALFMKYSNNLIGETLVKAMGANGLGPGEGDSTGSAVGSWKNGMEAMRRQLAGLGIDLSGMVIVDGSGLSYENRLRPSALVSALRIADDSFRFGPEFEAALPIAAADGTLRERASAAASQVRAKTGLLTRVTSLSGYAQPAHGERLAFSILVNGFRSGAAAAMDAVDAIAAELTR